MIFGAPLYGRVLRGEKTMTRRLVLTGHSPHKYQAGKRVAVQKGRGVPSEAHIILTAVRREPLGAITFEDARAEGFKTSFDFMAYWINLHDKAWVAKTEDECLDIYAESPHDTKSPSELLDMRVRRRFDTRWASKEVWVLTFALDHSEHPRLLADRNVRADYVESPARAMGGTADPGEAIDARLQDRYSREGHQGFVAREMAREIDREHMLAEERMRAVRIDAKAQGVDIGYLEGQILSRLRAAERKIHNHRAA